MSLLLVYHSSFVWAYLLAVITGLMFVRVGAQEEVKCISAQGTPDR